MARLTLSHRLFLVAVVAILPTIAILVLNLVTLSSDAERRLHEGAFNSAQIATLEISRIVGGVESLLNAVAAAPVVRAGNSDLCNEFLERVTLASRELSDMAVADANGAVVCRSGTSKGPISVADRDYFQAVRASGKGVTGTYSVGRLSGRATLPIAIPLDAEGAWSGGVIVGGIDLAWLGERLKERDYSQSNALTIADRNGRILAREPFPENFVGNVIPPAYLHLVTASEPGTLPVVSQDGTQRMLGFVPVSAQTHGLYISAGLSTDAIYSTARTLMLRGALVAFGGIAAALLLARFTSDYFIRRPFERLVGTIERWQRDELDTRTGMEGNLAEFGRAGRALDAFMDQLQATRRERRAAEAQRDLLAKELSHRIKNTIATIQALARRTFKGQGVDARLSAFSGRLQALAAAHTVLMTEGWHSGPIEMLLAETIGPFDDPIQPRIQYDGPDVELGPKATMSLSMALHELCTNATKYGALSALSGTVAIRWYITHADGEPTFHLTWSERGGPAVATPSNRGFGSVVIEDILAQQLGGTVVLEYDPAGLVCRISAPLRLVSADGQVEEEPVFGMRA